MVFLPSAVLDAVLLLVEVEDVLDAGVLAAEGVVGVADSPAKGGKIHVTTVSLGTVPRHF